MWTFRSLEEAILNFSGSVLVISHDRWFLDRVATHILAFEGDSKVRPMQGKGLLGNECSTGCPILSPSLAC